MTPIGYRPMRGAVSGGYGGFKTPHSNRVPVETLKSNFLFSVSHRMEIGGLNPPYPPLLGGDGLRRVGTVQEIARSGIAPGYQRANVQNGAYPRRQSPAKPCAALSNPAVGGGGHRQQSSAHGASHQLPSLYPPPYPPEGFPKCPRPSENRRALPGDPSDVHDLI